MTSGHAIRRNELKDHKGEEDVTIILDYLDLPPPPPSV